MDWNNRTVLSILRAVILGNFWGLSYVNLDWQIHNEAVELNDHSDNKGKMRRKACQVNQLVNYNSKNKQEVGIIMLLSNTM